MMVRKRIILLTIAAILPVSIWMLAGTEQPPQSKPAKKLVLLIHGGEGDLPPDAPPELEKQSEDVLAEALSKGYERLKEGGRTASLDAVEAAIRVMEDSPLFNAGKGAVFTHDGRNELDASIMEGKTKKAGAVAGVTIVKNPISAARDVMEHSPHVLLIGRGAELFSFKQKLDIVHPDYFWTERRWKELQEALRKEAQLRKNGEVAEAPAPRRHMGTVGAVALDSEGNLAAGTSTGGMTNKWSGRVGDSPIIGAGTYADNESCAVSCTGWGEYFIRYAVAYAPALRTDPPV
jgi:beta-aspartyl-peptidase (threonine type)